MRFKDVDTVVFDVGNVLLSFHPKEYLRERYDDEKIVKSLVDEIFRSQEWLDLDRGIISEEEALETIRTRVPHLAEEVEDVFVNFYQMFTPIEKTVEILRDLKERGFKLYVLSNFHESAFKYVEEAYDFFNLFDGGVVSSDHKLMKPEKAIFDLLIEKYNIDPAKALFIDDTKENTDMAETLGFKTWHFQG